MNYNIVAYSIYIPTTIALSIWIAKSLHNNTKAFLLERFTHNEALASSTNNLIQTGFYLIALGYSFLKMRIRNGSAYIDNKVVYEQLASSQQTIEELAMKLGGFTLILGLLLFTNFIIMLMIQKPKKQQQTNTFTINQPK
jgi:hypothetical protein